MTDWIKDTLTGAIHGKLAHTEMLNALEEITVKEAETPPKDNMHSIWNHVFHMVFWHDITMKAIQGKETDWNKIKGTDWLPKTTKYTKQKWEKLIATFTQSLEELKEILETHDLTKPISGFGDMPLGKGIVVEIQHNSYHIGQIVLIRQLQGNWPPPEEK